MEPFVPSSSTTIENPSPLVELGLIPYIPYQEQEVADLSTIFYDKNKKSIVIRTEKKMDSRDQPIDIMVTKKIVLHGNNKDTKLLAAAGVASALANADNVNQMVDDIEKYKEKMSQVKETSRKESGEGHSLKRKYNDTLTELERLKEAYQILQLDKDALILSDTITK